MTAGAPRPSIVVALQRSPVVWLSSVRPDGGPHVVPLWFLWDRRSILVFSKPGAQKVRNIRAEPRVMVAVGEPGLAFDVELVDAVAELAAQPTSRVLPDEFAHKYADLADRAGITFDRFAAIYEQPIWIRPTRWLDWGGTGWTDAAGYAAGRPTLSPIGSVGNAPGRQFGALLGSR
ncbi:MAG: pyridoxamine 5'-phosphate oxidase family protein [Chloroflexota bacterium]